MTDKNTDQIGLYFVGEARVDQRADHENPRKLLVALGGSMYFGSMGAASAIKHLELKNVKSFYVGPISDDYFGHLISDDFKEVGVETSYTRSSPFLSRISVISEDGKGGNKYSFYTCTQSDVGALKLEDLPSTFNEPKRIFAFGSVTTTLSHDGLILKEFAKLQTAKGSIVLFDPNTRPTAIPNVSLYRDALEDWIKTANVVKASEEDIEFTYPGKTAQQLADHWLSFGPKAVFVTHGEKGCSVYQGKESAHVATTFSPLIKRTVGAGDNFNAGIVTALAEKSITNIDQLDSLTIEDWKKIAMTANNTSYQHLLRVNNLTDIAGELRKQG